MTISKLLITVIVIIFFLQRVSGQSFSDTIYYSAIGEICSKKISTRYRYCTLKSSNDKLLFTGKVKDYYSTGELALEGVYNENGKRDGEFISYYRNGKILKEGSFKEDNFYGSWLYYNDKGNIYLQLNFLSGIDFIPFFFVDKNGDTTLNNGTGTFTIKLNEYQDVFGKDDYTIQGSSVNGLKDGHWNYFNSTGYLFYEELYDLGRFEKSYFNSILKGRESSKEQKHYILPVDHLLESAEFFWFDITFQDDALLSHNEKEDNYFTKKEDPILNLSSKDQINSSVYSIVREVLKAYQFRGSGQIVESPVKSFYDKKQEILFTRKILLDKKYTPEEENSLSIYMNINSMRNTDSISIQVSKNISDSDVYRLGYYLSRLNIVQQKNSNNKIPEMHFSIYTKNEKIKVESVNYLKQEFYFYTRNLMPDSATNNLKTIIYHPLF